jgi:glycosyltransferase involved in cell wall biosynthesis
VKVTLLMPVLNEIEGMKIVMPHIKKEWCDQIIVLDGNSTDGTREWAHEQGYTVFKQLGRGAWDGYKEVFEAGIITGDIVITFSPDGNSVPFDLPSLIKKMADGYDMVIASRYLGWAKSDDDTLFSRAGNWFGTSLINLICKADYTDALVIYRAYRADLPKELGFVCETPWLMKQLQKLVSMTSWELGLSVRCAKRGLKVGEIPSDEPCRVGSDRKAPPKWKHAIAMLSQLGYELAR